MPLTYYDILCVQRNASLQQIRQAYRRLAQKNHPDKRAGHETDRHAMAAINQAYEVLSDPARRLGHDRWIDRLNPQALAAAEASASAAGSHVVRWPWYVLVGTVCVVVCTVSATLYFTVIPLRAAGVVSPSQTRPAVASQGPPVPAAWRR